MSGIEALASIGAQPVETAIVAPMRQPAAPQAAAPADFSALIAEGLQSMDAKVAHADQMVSRFALDDSVPLHQVTIALEEARLSVEFAMQVRQRFVEGYRELMNMQL